MDRIAINSLPAGSIYRLQKANRNREQIGDIQFQRESKKRDPTRFMHIGESTHGSILLVRVLEALLEDPVCFSPVIATNAIMLSPYFAQF